MGICKRIRTAFTIKCWSEYLDEATVLGLVRREKQYQAYQVKEAQRKKQLIVAIDTVYLRTDYVGNIPTQDGQYLVMDLVTKSMQQVTVTKDANDHIKICSLGEHMSVTLDVFNFKSYRWYRLSQPSPEDWEMMRKLKVS